MPEFTIADARRVQRDLGLLESHVAYVDLDTDWFVLAHTDTERSKVWDAEVRALLVDPGLVDTVSLADCPVHVYLRQGNLECRLCCVGGAWGAANYCPVNFVFPATGWYELPTSSLHDVRGLAF